jgi:predicted amidohydrolase
MQDIWQLIGQDDWAGALVCLAARANTQTLAIWESQSSKREVASHTPQLLRRLQLGPLLTAAEIEEHPLALLCALDGLVATTSRLRFTATPFAIGGASWWLLPVETPIRERAAMRGQVPRLDHYLKHHVVVPTQLTSANELLHVRATVPTGNLAHGLQGLANGDAPLKAWIAHFDDGCCVQLQPAAPSQRVLAVGFDDEAKRLQTAATSLSLAANAGAHLVLAAELSLTPAHQAELVRRWVDLHQPTQPSLLLLGSFHQTIDGVALNVAELTDGYTGLPLFKQHKLRIFGRYGADLQDDSAEAIVPGNEIHLLVTALGVFTVLICKDFVDSHFSVRGLLQQVGADWVLVPSYGDDRNREAQVRRAREVCFVETGCHLLLASQRNEGFSVGDALPGFWHPSGVEQAQFVSKAGGCVSIPLAPMPVAPPYPGLRRVK